MTAVRPSTARALLAAGLTLAALSTPQEAAGATVRGSYVVVYEDHVQMPEAATDRRERREGFHARLRYSEAIKGFAAQLSPRQVAQLRDDPAVSSVTADRTVRTADVAALAAGETVPTGVHRIEAATESTARERSAAGIAVLDTGIDLDHPDLDAVDGTNCMQPGAPADDDHGHGTHVAGTIAATNDGAGAVGVAPGTRLSAVKVLDAAGSGTFSSLICGIDWVTSTRTDADPANDISVANMSIVGSGDPVEACGTTADPLHTAICDSTAAGVTYVVAAGNDGWDFDFAQQPDVPAAYGEVLTVTAMADSDGTPGGTGGPLACEPDASDDTVASFSNYAGTAAAERHTVAAPGTCILSTAMGGGHETRSGTSMAAPHVAGAVALCVGTTSAPGPCAGLTPAEVVERMRSQAERHTARLAAYGFAGDPSRPVPDRYYGYLAAAGDTDPPTPSLVQPAGGSTITEPTPVLRGTAGTAAGDASTVSVELFAGASSAGTPVRTLHTMRSGASWSVSVAAADALSGGTYTARATQGDDAGNVGRSAEVTFVLRAPAPVAAPVAAPVTAPSEVPATARVGASDEPRHPAALSLARARVVRQTKRLDVLAPISRRASGTVRVTLRAAGRTYAFSAGIDSARGRIRFNRRIPAAQARVGTGILTIAYPGDGDTRPQRIRLRAAPHSAGLKLGRPTLTGGRLRAAGTIARRARGVVRLQIDYVSGGRDHTHEYAAVVRRGRWRIDEALPVTVRAAVAARRGTVQSYALFTGYLPEELRGELRAYQVLGRR